MSSNNSIVEDILKSRYFQKGETSWYDICARVCNYLCEPEDSEKYHKYITVMENKQFIPSSPVLFNAGTKCSSLAACYGLGIADNIDSIYTTLHRTAKIFKSGGGSGTNFSTIRPANSIVNGTNGVASGPISFMKLFNSSSETIVQGGRRRGASIGILDILHPSIEEFIICKNEEGILSNFNISVMITDEFMKAVENNTDWNLVFEGKVYKTVKARDLYNKICKSVWTRAEPGILFYDTINKDNTSSNPINTCNPCSELPLEVDPDTLCGECCVLGSINLIAMIKNNKIDYNLLKETTKTAVDFLNDVIDKNEYPLPEIGEMTKANRRIGLGIMGFADVLIALGMKYDASSETINLIRCIMRTIRDAAFLRSEELAKKFGGYPNQRTTEKPIRNATRLAIAPTGTISMIAGVSSGIEPNFSYVYDRKNSLGTYLQVHEQFEKDLRRECTYVFDKKNKFDLAAYNIVIDQMHKKGTIQDIDWLSNEFRNKYVTATDVSPASHIAIQAEFQKYVDSSISKTINCPESTTIEDIEQYIMSAWKQGIKGLTFYRQNSRQDVVLNLKKENDKSCQKEQENLLDKSHSKNVKTVTPEIVMAPNSRIKQKRQRCLSGKTYSAQSGCCSLFVNVNKQDGKVFEVFVRAGSSGGCSASFDALARMISINLQCGINPKEIIHQLHKVSCPAAISNKNSEGKSCGDIIGNILKECLPDDEESTVIFKIDAQNTTSINTPPIIKSTANSCPECGAIISMENGCVTCHSCGWSRCG